MAELALPPLLARSPWIRRLLVPVVFSLALFFFLFATFPYDSLGDRIVIEARNAGYELSFATLGHAGFIGLKATDVKLKPIAADPSATPTEIHLDSLTLKPELLGLLLKKPAVAFSVEAYGGAAHGVARFSSDPKAPGLAALTINADSFDLKALPSSFLSGVEVIGQFGMTADVTSLQMLEASGGNVAFSLKGAALVKGTAMGIPLPKATLGELSGSLSLDKGVAKLDNVKLRGGDIEGEVEGTIKMKPLLSLSQADLKLHVNPKDSWLDANPLVKGSMGFLGQKQPDGWHATLSGPLSNLRPAADNSRGGPHR